MHKREFLFDLVVLVNLVRFSLAGFSVAVLIGTRLTFLPAISFQNSADSASQKVMSVTRSSVDRRYRLTPLTVMVRKMKIIAMMIPSGRSITFPMSA